jgi:hypothetical protein
MAPLHLMAALGLALVPSAGTSYQTGAPPAPPTARYCMTIEQMTGTHLITIECWTRQEWAQFDVDVDQEWSEHGERVVLASARP